LQFLWRVTSSALASQREDKIHARVTIAQAILESATPKFGWRSSELFRIANNPFGIMYAHFGARSSGKGENAGIQHAAPKPEDYGAFDAQTWEIENGQKKVIIAQFQRFPNLGEPFRAHALLLRGPRYRPAFAVRDDWKKFAERLGPKTSQLDLEPCGYSTNPSYSAEPIKLVNFYRLNDPGALQCLATGKDPGGGYGNRDTGHKTEALAPNPVSRIPSPEKQS
jgi:flagellum-specific peptidoglycan hydrolase FlgJ